MRNKQMRQTRIRELLYRRAIDTHEKLAEVLQQQGIEVSQSTLSKDLREIGVVRVPQADGGFRYTLPEAGSTLRDLHILERELQDFLVQAEQVINMVLCGLRRGTPKASVRPLIALVGPRSRVRLPGKTRSLSSLVLSKMRLS